MKSAIHHTLVFVREPRNIRKCAVSIFLLALLVRVAALFFLIDPSDRGYTDPLYEIYARNVASGKGYCAEFEFPGAGPITLRAFRPPLFPMVWGLLYRATHGAYTPIRLMNAAFGAAACAVVYLMGVLVFSPAAGFFGALTCCFYPPLIWHSINLMTEPFFIFFLNAALLMLVLAWRRDSTPAAAAAGAAMALGTLSRSVLQGFAPIAPLWLFAVARSRKRAAFMTAVYVVGFVCVMSPWWIRNYRVFHKFVPSTTDSGHGFFIGNNPHTLADPRGVWMPDSWEFLKGLSETEIDKTLFHRGLNYVEHHPRMWVRLALDKFCRFWRPIPHAQFIGRTAAIAAGASFCGAAILILPGLFWTLRQWREHWQWLLLVALLVGYMTGIHMIFIAVTRYRVPIMPALLLFGGRTLAALAQFFEKKGHVAKPSSLSDSSDLQ